MIRDAAAGDADASAEIYAHYVRTSAATFEEEPPDPGELRRRIAAVQSARLPWLILLDEAGALVAYAYAAPYRTRSAYRFTVENSVYVSPRHFRRGFGSAVMRHVIERCTALGYRQMLAVIGDSGNTASISLHARL